jgi:hypothetical protein
LQSRWCSTAPTLTDDKVVVYASKEAKKPMRYELTKPVGPGKTNLAEDVSLVQRLLDRQAARTGIVVMQTSRFDRATQYAIETYQRRVLHMAFADGVVTPGDSTFRQLIMTTPQRLMAGAAGGLILPVRTGGTELEAEDYASAATILGCEVRVIKAVTKIEAPRGAYDELGRPSILFERHLFHRFTGGRHDRTAPDISNANRGGYGRYAAQHDRLQRAYALDASAALRATSWGAFQILGDNYAQAGFGTVDLFVTAMCQSIQQQLAAFVAFINFSPSLRRALDQRHWADFARHYNGPAYRANHYDTNLQEAYDAATP